MAHVVLLRGVNVGGHRTFRPSLLARALARYDVVNIGAAGTFVVRARARQDELRAAFCGELPFATEITVCKARDFAAIAADDPFEGERLGDDVTRFVSVLAKRPRLAPSMPFALPAEGEWLVRIVGARGRFVFRQYRRHLRTIGYLGTLDRVFGVPVTTRSWSTVAAIGDALRSDLVT
jgi:uncharacterized protein (DUF1697 family)